MWALDNRTPYAADRNWTRDKDGVHWWLVAVRATYLIDANGKLTLADEQLPPVLAPEHFGKPGESSLRYDSDLLARKPSTDVIVVGSAHAPKGKAAATVPVVLRVGTLEKTLIVHGERVYYDGVSTTSPIPFTTRPIQYELAFGGSDFTDPDATRHRMDERNPVGRGVRKGAGTVAHVIEYPTGDPRSAGPAGFGPIDWSWLPRRKLAGTYDAGWSKHKKPLLPDDYNPAFSLCAPTDQRLGQPLTGGERIGLLNLSPEGALVVELPTVRLEMRSHFGNKAVPHEPTMLTTVSAEPDDRRLSLVWQSALRVGPADLDYLDTCEIVERRGP